MIVPLVLGALGLVALIASNKKSGTDGASASSLNLLPTDLGGMAKQALATNDPNVLNTAADTLDAHGFHAQAQALRDAASKASTAQNAKGGAAALPPALQTLMAQALAALTVSGSGQLTGPITAQGIQTASAVAAQLDQAGFPDAASSLRVFIQKANLLLPPPSPAQTLPLPGLSPALQAQVNQAIQTNRDPKQLRQLIAVLKSLPANPQTQQAIDTLTAIADQVDAAIATAQAMQQIQNTLPPVLPTSSPGLPQAQQPAPGAPPALPPPSAAPAQVPPQKSKQQVLAETVASGLVRLQTAAAGAVKKVQGKEDKASVMRFQSQEGLTADGKAGPKTMLALAKYTGNVPLVMYWGAGSNAQAVYAYRAALQEIADAALAAGDATRSQGLQAAALAERGQGGIVGSIPV